MNKGFYDTIFDKFKEFVNEHSIYAPRIVKTNSRESSYFPLISCELKNYTDSNNKTQKNIDKNKNFYFTINIYARDIPKKGRTISSQMIVDELCELTHSFFGEMLGMFCSTDTPTPNLDTEILRQTIQYQGNISNRGNIYR